MEVISYIYAKICIHILLHGRSHRYKRHVVTCAIDNYVTVTFIESGKLPTSTFLNTGLLSNNPWKKDYACQCI